MYYFYYFGQLIEHHVNNLTPFFFNQLTIYTAFNIFRQFYSERSLKDVFSKMSTEKDKFMYVNYLSCLSMPDILLNIFINLFICLF